MSHNDKRALMPKRRFPGFQDAWSSSPMSKMYAFKGTNSLSRDQLNYEGGSFRNIHYGDIHKKFPQHFRVSAESVPYVNEGESHSTMRPENFCTVGDVVLADASEDVADIGKAIEIMDAGDTPLVAGSHTILAKPFGNSFALGFGAYVFASEYVRTQIQRESQGAKVLGLSATRLGNVRLPYPIQVAEQRKISDCLSSLDERIAAESRKIESLRAYKRGLTQSLFPADGETVPSLRFPEFQKTGQWVKAKVSDLVQRTARAVELDVDRMYQEIGIRSHGKGIFQKQPVSGGALGEKRVFWVEVDALVLNIVFAWEQAVAITSAAEAGMIASHRFPMYKPRNSRSDVNFLKYFFLTAKGKELLGIASPGGAGRNKTLGQSEFEKLELLVPASLAEQTAISSNLSSLDDLIAGQAQRIEQLSCHKQGLMQQLFPVLEEVPS